jgi:hypothetical protein
MTQKTFTLVIEPSGADKLDIVMDTQDAQSGDVLT